MEILMIRNDRLLTINGTVCQYYNITGLQDIIKVLGLKWINN